MLQVYLVELYNYLSNVLHFYIFNHDLFGHHNVFGYGVQ